MSSKRQFSVLVSDPHGDLGRAVLGLAINDRKRIFYISSAINHEAKTEKNYTCVFNPFVCSDNSPEMRFLLTETLSDSLAEVLIDATLTVQMISIIKPVLATTIRHPDASLALLSRFFLEGQNHDLVELGKTSDVEQHRQFFMYEWDKEHLRVSKNSLRVKLSYILSDSRLSAMLNGKPTIDLEGAINDGSLIIFNMPKGSGTFSSKVMGKLLLGYINALMMRRDAIEDRKKRKPLYLILDEAANIMTQSLATSLAESRKYGLSCILAMQTLGQVNDTSMRKVIEVNTGLKAVGLTSHQDRVFFAKEMGITTSEIELLHPLEFYLKRNDGSKKAFKFTASILSKAYFLTKNERKNLFDWLVYESGQYVPVPPPPATPSYVPVQSYTPKHKKNSKPNNSNNEGLKPAF